MSIEFDVTGPLPQGLMMIEASAGTGKTYTLTALAVRSIAEDDIAVSSLCLVTFTEAATAEMRGRLRGALTQALAHLVSDDEEHPDTVIDALGRDTARRGVYAARLERALAELDTAWITTIHGWCARVLGSAGVWQAMAGTLVNDDDITEVLHDLIVGRYAVTGDLPAKVSDIAKAVRLRLSMPLAVMQGLELADLSGATAAKQRKQAEGLAVVQRIDELVQLVDDIVTEVLERRARRGHQTFDGLLEETRRLLFEPGHGDLVETLRRRFEVVLIDEFQDTDQIQWDIFRQAFHEPLAEVSVPPVRRLVLVGDPKQSIYRFRAAELSAYLAARRVAQDQVRTLRVNRRSDPSLLAGVDHLLRDTTYGDEAVRFESVRAPEGTPWSRLDGLGEASMQLRLVSDVPTDAPSLRRAVRNDVVSTVHELLGPGVSIDDSRPGHARRRLRPADIAILTFSNADAASTALDLSAAGIPAATASSNSVLDSAAGQQWRVLLAALARPGHLPTARAAAVGWFVGLGLEHVADDERFVTADGVDVVDQLHRWASDLERGGLPLLLRSLGAAGWQARLLDRIDGERHLTDVDHIAELLQSATAARPVSAAAALEAFDALEAAADERVTATLLARRIDRDDDAVQVVTIHKAKGLEFPVVLCPYLWTQSASRKGLPHASVDDVRVIDTLTMFGKKVTDAMRRLLVAHDVKAADEEERRAEERRLAYVALTRAKHRCIVWWADASGACEFRSIVNARGGPLALAAQSGGTVEAITAATGASLATTSEAVEIEVLPEPAVATRHLDGRWRIWSFTAIKAAADDVVDAPVIGGADEIDPSAASDEAEPPEEPSNDVLVTRMLHAPGGTRFGTTVHRILERCDFDHDDLAGELTDRCRIELAHRGLNISPQQLAAGLLDVLAAPLGGPADLPPLQHLARSDRLDELDFHLPAARTSTQAVARALVDHLGPDDPARAWAVAVAAGALPTELDGRLTGSVDLVARHGPEQQVWIADYKTNRLGPTNGADPGELVDVMNHSHYWMQATLYLVAMHRYLRWRRPDYEPDRHLIGAAYLFVRAMTPDAPGAGVVWWRPPTAAIEAVDHVLGEGGGA